MSEEARNVEMLRKAVWRLERDARRQRRSVAGNLRREDRFGSLANGPPGSAYLTAYQARDDLKDYFAGLARDWEMIEYEVDHFVAQGDRVVMLGRCTWKYRKTGKVVWTPKADSWRFDNGKAVEFFEYYDTAQVLAAVA